MSRFDRTSHRSCRIAAMLLLAACADDGPASPGGNSGTEGSLLPCPPTDVPLESLDAVHDALGFSAADVLVLTRTREVSLRWDVRDSGPELVPQSDTLSILVEPSSDTATAVVCDDPNYADADRPEPYLEVPITISLKTDDGLIDERIETTLVAAEPTHAAVHTIAIEPEDFVGSVGQAVGVFYVDGQRNLMFDLTFTEDGPVGWMFGPFSPHASTPCRETIYATWPADAVCWPGQQEEATDEAELRTHLQRANQTLELVWEDGAVIDATLDVELAEGPTCRTDLYVSHLVRMRLRTSDERVDLTLQGSLIGGPALVYQGDDSNAKLRPQRSSPEYRPGVDDEAFHLELSAAVALDAEGMLEHLDLADASVGAAIVSIHLTTDDGTSAGTVPLQGEIRAIAIDRTGFATPLPAGELPGVGGLDNERCFDAENVRRPPLLRGNLALK
jgi:hypothetical protein